MPKQVGKRSRTTTPSSNQLQPESIQRSIEKVLSLPITKQTTLAQFDQIITGFRMPPFLIRPRSGNQTITIRVKHQNELGSAEFRVENGKQPVGLGKKATWINTIPANRATAVLVDLEYDFAMTEFFKPGQNLRFPLSVTSPQYRLDLVDTLELRKQISRRYKVYVQRLDGSWVEAEGNSDPEIEPKP